MPFQIEQFSQHLAFEVNRAYRSQYIEIFPCLLRFLYVTQHFLERDKSFKFFRFFVSIILFNCNLPMCIVFQHAIIYCNILFLEIFEISQLFHIDLIFPFFSYTIDAFCFILHLMNNAGRTRKL